MKAILVIETPSSCSECPCISLGCCNAVGGVGFCRTIGDIFDKPDWCPLKEVPQKQPTEMKTINDDINKLVFNEGYNACIDEILGDKERK